MQVDRLTRGVRHAATGSLIISSILLVPRVAQAQTGRIAGRIADATTLMPLASAQVFIPGTDLGTLTDAQGRYELADRKSVV